MSDSFFASPPPFLLVRIGLGGGVWLIKEPLDPAPKHAPAAPEKEATSLPSHALDAPPGQ